MFTDKPTSTTHSENSGVATSKPLLAKLEASLSTNALVLLASIFLLSAGGLYLASLPPANAAFNLTAKGAAVVLSTAEFFGVLGVVILVAACSSLVVDKRKAAKVAGKPTALPTATDTATKTRI